MLAIGLTCGFTIVLMPVSVQILTDSMITCTPAQHLISLEDSCRRAIMSMHEKKDEIKFDRLRGVYQVLYDGDEEAKYPRFGNVLCEGDPNKQAEIDAQQIPNGRQQVCQVLEPEFGVIFASAFYFSVESAIAPGVCMTRGWVLNP